jgi:hypothetical protein
MDHPRSNGYKPIRTLSHIIPQYFDHLPFDRLIASLSGTNGPDLIDLALKYRWLTIYWGIPIKILAQPYTLGSLMALSKIFSLLSNQ